MHAKYTSDAVPKCGLKQIMTGETKSTYIQFNNLCPSYNTRSVFSFSSTFLSHENCHLSVCIWMVTDTLRTGALLTLCRWNGPLCLPSAVCHINHWPYWHQYKPWAFVWNQIWCTCYFFSLIYKFNQFKTANPSSWRRHGRKKRNKTEDGWAFGAWFDFHLLLQQSSQDAFN